MPYFPAEGRQLRQADILNNVRAFELESFTEDNVPYGRILDYEFAIIVSQDCDLEQDFSARFQEGETQNTADKLLFSIMLCGVYDESAIKAGCHRTGATQLGRKEFEQVIQNKQPRYQYLGFVPQAKKTLVVDFKTHFFVSGTYLYRMLDEEHTQRINSLKEPWRDHVLQRFAFYLMRVGLPKEFDQLKPPLSEESPSP